MIRTFLRVLGLIYFIAFSSFGVQASGLIGSHGILPYAAYLAGMRQALGRTAYWEIPTVLWLNWSDAALAVLWLAGAVCALVAVSGYVQRVALAVCVTTLGRRLAARQCGRLADPIRVRRPWNRRA